MKEVDEAVAGCGREAQGMEVAGKMMVPRWRSRIQPHFASLEIYNIELTNCCVVCRQVTQTMHKYIIYMCMHMYASVHTHTY